MFKHQPTYTISIGPSHLSKVAQVVLVLWGNKLVFTEKTQNLGKKHEKNEHVIKMFE